MNNKIKIILLTSIFFLIAYPIFYTIHQKHHNPPIKPTPNNSVHEKHNNESNENISENVIENKSYENSDTSCSEFNSINDNNESNTDNLPENNKENNKDIVSKDTKCPINISSYISKLSYSTYVVKPQETASIILRRFEKTCNFSTAITYLRLLNPSLNLDNLEISSTLKIPTEALNNGKLYKIVSGDTWYKIAGENYPEYKTDDIINFLITINNLPNTDCPIEENIFLPSLK